MSPRAACRLETLGFTEVYDYVPGKVDWLAHNLPADGEQAARLTAGFCHKIGPGGACPHCDEPVAVADLLDAPPQP